ncbi:MAG: ABC transporter substrate-binding protein [Alphaproteobacteria bacterium]|nr:MAG: ABC transporter substrate-binding protein [Alphaproteobacteria bacterium]
MIAKLRIWLSGVVMTFQRVPPEHKVGAAPDQREPTRQIDVQERQMRVSVVLAGRERRGNRDFKCIEPMKRRDLITAIPAAAILRSAAGRAQSLQVPLIGFVHGSAPVGQYKSYVASFVAGLREEDFESGRNVAVEYRWAEGEYERVPGLTTDLLSLKPSLIVAYGPPNLLRAALDAASRDVPIVFGTGGDPVAAGIVASLARPGGNATGVANRTNTLDIKRLELLRDLVPQASIIAMILNPKNSDAQEVTKGAQEGARTLGRELVVAYATMPEQLDQAFASVVQQGAGAMLMGSDTFLNAQADRIIALAARYRMPAMYNGRAFVERGGLIGYGTNFADMYRLVGIYAGKVLKGAKPADLPVVEPTRFELLINLNTAKALGLAIPQTVLARADEVVE